MLKIYFKGEKKINAEAGLEALMRNATLNLLNGNSNNIPLINDHINQSLEAKNIIKGIVDKQSIITNNHTYSSNVHIVDIDQYYGNHKFGYEIIINTTSIIYTCVKIIDELTFLCYHSNDNELKIVKKTAGYNVYVVE